jgi:hypothetical protein
VTSYPANHNAYVFTPRIDTGLSNPFLRYIRFEHLCTIGTGDYGEVYIDLDDDGIFDLLDRLEGSITGNDDVLDPYTIDLQNSPTGLDVSKAGQFISVLFLLYSDMTGGEGPYLGWIIDNVELEWSNSGPEQCDRYNCGGCIAPLFSVSTPAPVCVGMPASFTGTTIDPGVGTFSYQWTFGDASPAQNVSKPEDVITHPYSASGSYTAILTATDAVDPGCRSDVTTSARVDQLPVLAASNNSPVCVGTPVSFQGSTTSPGVGPYGYAWDFGDGSPLSPVAAPTEVVLHTYAGAGPFTARLAASNLDVPGCTSYAETTVQLHVPPTLQASNNGPICVGQSVDLTASVVDPGSGTYTYEWDLGDASPVQPVASPTDVVSHSYTGTGPYTATLTATHTTFAGCISTSQTVVTIDTGTNPTGNLANSLKVYKSAGVLKLDWRPASLNPRSYNVLRTESRLELDDTAAGIGDETRIDPPVRSREQATDTAVLKDGRSYFYEVWGANVCTEETVFP